MRKLLFCLFLIVPFFSANAGTISVGYSSTDVLLWRFWEIDSNHVAHPKILVYNITDKPLTFLLKKTNSRGSLDPLERSGLAYRFQVFSDTIVKTITIAPHDHGVYDIVALKSSGLFDAVLINGVYCGIMPELTEVTVEKYVFKYYSHEGVAGSMNCLIGKNNLFTNRGETDSTTLIFDCTYKPYKEKSRLIEAQINDGVEMVSLFFGNSRYDLYDANKRTEFTVNIENIQSFTINMEYKIGKNDLVPGINFHNKVPQNAFSMGCWLPVFVK